jgi:hypothetical protein
MMDHARVHDVRFVEIGVEAEEREPVGVSEIDCAFDAFLGGHVENYTKKSSFLLKLQIT